MVGFRSDLMTGFRSLLIERSVLTRLVVFRFLVFLRFTLRFVRVVTVELAALNRSVVALALAASKLVSALVGSVTAA